MRTAKIKPMKSIEDRLKRLEKRVDRQTDEFDSVIIFDGETGEIASGRPGNGSGVQIWLPKKREIPTLNRSAGSPFNNFPALFHGILGFSLGA